MRFCEDVWMCMCGSGCVVLIIIILPRCSPFCNVDNNNNNFVNFIYRIMESFFLNNNNNNNINNNNNKKKRKKGTVCVTGVSTGL